MSKSEEMLLALEQQNLEEAQLHFREALEEDKDEELLTLAQYLEQIGFLPQAGIIYERLLDSYPEVAINLAGIAAEDGKIEEAFAYLDRFDEDSPHYVEVLVSQADFYQLEGLTDVAKEKLLLACQLSDNPLLRFGLAEIEMELENYQSAIRLYAQLDNRFVYETSGVSTYQRIGLAYANLGKFESALEFLEKAVQLDYDDRTLFELAALLFDQKNYQRANLYFKQLETLNPDFEGYEFLYAQSLHAEHRTEEALELLRQGLAKNDMDSSLLLLASQYAYELKDSQSAERYLLQAKDWAEDSEEVDLRLSTLYLDQKRFDEVIALEREDLDHVLTRWNIARAYRALEAEEEAFRAYQALEKDLAKNPDFLKDYIYLLQEVGAVDKAGELAQAYMQLVPDDMEIADFLHQISED